MHSIWEKNSFVSFDCIIVGGGILGLSAAISIKELDPSKDILVLERGAIPSGASTKNAGFACFGSLTEILSDFGRIGKEQAAVLVEKRWKGIELLRKRLGDDAIGFLNYGGYELIGEEHISAIEEIDSVNQLLGGIFGGVVFSEAADKAREFGFDENTVKTIVYSPFESQIDTGRMMRSLISLASSKGILIVSNYEAVIDDVRDGEVSVSSHNSEVTFTCRRLISCSNAFTSVLLPETLIKPGRGQVIATSEIAGLPFRGVFHIDEGYYYFRNYGSRVILGGGRNLDFEGEETFLFGNTDTIVSRLDYLLRNVILPGRDFVTELVWSGIMGFNESRLPEVLKVNDSITAGFCCNGMGVALASLVAGQIAEEVCG